MNVLVELVGWYRHGVQKFPVKGLSYGYHESHMVWRGIEPGRP